MSQFLFEPIFNAKTRYGNQWTSYTKTNVWFFRDMSRKYIDTDRYQNLFAKLQKLNGFWDIWEATEHH